MITELLSSAGIAAVVSAALTYLFKPLLEAKLSKSMGARLEAIRAAYVAEHEYLKELVKRNADLYPTLIESVYRCRNIAREMEERAPDYDATLRAELGNHALALTEGLYRARIFLPRQLFEPLHEFKRTLQQFVFDYDLLTGPSPTRGVRDAMLEARVKLDGLYDQALSSAQASLGVATLPGKSRD